MSNDIMQHQRELESKLWEMANSCVGLWRPMNSRIIFLG